MSSRTVYDIIKRFNLQITYFINFDKHSVTNAVAFDYENHDNIREGLREHVIVNTDTKYCYYSAYDLKDANEPRFRIYSHDPEVFLNEYDRIWSSIKPN